MFSYPLRFLILRWGDYRKCDTPLRTIEAMYKHIANHHSIDLIYWTGDLPPHDIWKQSRQGNVEVESELFSKNWGATAIGLGSLP